MKTIHEGAKDLPCNKCCKYFRWKSNLQKHIENIHEGAKRYSCDKCPKIFGMKEYLQRHVKTIHVGIKDLEHLLH